MSEQQRFTVGTNNKRRDRWASSSSGSSDDNDDGGKNPIKKTNTSRRKLPPPTEPKSPLTTTTNNNISNDKSDIHRPLAIVDGRRTPITIVNPLLSGCRSVYDTYERIERISEGSYGIVWKAKSLQASVSSSQEDGSCCGGHPPGGVMMALKQMKFPNESNSSIMTTTTTSNTTAALRNGIWKDGFPIMALREINALLALRGHANIVQLHEIVTGGHHHHHDHNNRDKDDTDQQQQQQQPIPPQIYMVMDYYHCDLKTAIHQYTTEVIGGPLLQSELKGILQQILTGIEFIHAKGYIHRDLKPSNILVQYNSNIPPPHTNGSTTTTTTSSNHPSRIVIADFGLARRYDSSTAAAHTHMTLPVVTLWYRAPELLFGQTQYTPAIDMWSMGCMMGELIRSSGMVPPTSTHGTDHDDDDDFNHSHALLKGRGELDQIDAIFQLVGVPNATTWPLFETLPNAKLLRWRAIADDDILLPRLFPTMTRSIHSGTISFCSQQTFLDSNGYNLLQHLLALDPLQRIDAQQALRNPYFSQGVVPKIPNFHVGKE
jgi:cell division cycle 2-like